MLRNSNEQPIIPYTEVVNLTNNRTFCKLTYVPTDIKSLYIVFENCDNVIPGVLQVFNGTFFTDYCDIKIIKIVKERHLDGKFSKKDNVFYHHYNSDYVKNNFSNVLRNKTRFNELIGSYIIDWTGSEKILKMIKDNSSTYVSLNYYIPNDKQ